MKRNRRTRRTARSSTTPLKKQPTRKMTRRSKQDDIEKPTSRKTARRKKDEKTLYIGITALVVIIFIIIIIIASQGPSKPRRTVRSNVPDIEKAQQLSVRGQKLLGQSKYREAQKVLKQSKDILHKGIEYYKNKPRQQKRIERMLQMVNERYAAAYHHSPIK